MNLRTTLVLALLVGVGGAAWYFGPRLAPVVGLAPQSVNPNGAGSPDVLEKQLTRDRVTRIEVRSDGEPVILEKGPGGSWALPGNWPTRSGEADELISLLTSLKTRFQVIAYDGPEFDLKPYGLDPDQKPVMVAIETESEKVRLAFGEPRDEESGPFARPTYVQVNGKPEIVRLGPDILPVLKRPREYYQRRQLFPQVDRVKFADAPAPSQFGPPAASPGPVPLPRARKIVLESPQGKLVLEGPPQPIESTNSMDGRRLARLWQIVDPVNDRADADRLKALLSVIPNLWVESFTPPKETALVAAALASAPAEHAAVALAWSAMASQANQPGWLLQVTGLEKPEYKITVTPASGNPVVLHVGKVSRVEERPGTPMPPPQPGMPPMPPQPIREEYRYARLDGQPIIFEIRADKFADLFVSAAVLRDARLDRFQTADVKEVQIKNNDINITLSREADDRWRLVQPVQALADSDKVRELVDKLSGLEARDADVVDNANLKDAGLEPPAQTITLKLDEEISAGNAEKQKQPRTVVFTFGKRDEAAKKVSVQVSGRTRVNRVDDSVASLVTRPALAYRGRRVFDFDAATVAKVDVTRPGEKFVLTQADGEWKLTTPVAASADAAKAGELAADLSRLEAIEYVNDSPSAKDLADAGLATPELSAVVTFSASGQKPLTLQVGRQRPGKPEFFAKLADGTSIFAIKNELRDRLNQDSLSYRPTQLWEISGAGLTSVKVERGAEIYEVKQEGADWKIIRPFQATASLIQVTGLVEAIAGLKLLGYQAHSTMKLAEFGLDNPVAKITFQSRECAKDGTESPRERTLWLGKAVEGKPEVFAKLADDPAVFRVANTVLTSVNRPALDLLDRRLLSIDGRRITKFERTGSLAMSLVKDGATWKVQAGPQVSFTADQPTIDSTVRAWELLQAERFVAYGPDEGKLKEFGLNPPQDTVTITLDQMVAGKPVTHVMKLGKAADGAGRFGRLDDQPGVFVLAPVVARDLARGHLDFADRGLLNVNEPTIQGLLRAMKDNDVEITRKDGWKVIKPTEQKADDAFLGELAADLSKLRADRVVAYAPADLKPFGLDSPAAVITVLIEKDGKPAPQTIRIGAPVDPMAADGERFVQVEGAKAVGVLSRSDSRRLLAEPIAYRDRSLVKRLPEPDQVKLQRGDRKATFAKSEGSWKMTDPIATEAEHAELEEFINSLFRLRADELVAEKPNADKLKQYGLDKPEAAWSFLSEGKEVLSLQIGKPDSTGQRVFARLGNGDVVFVLNPSVTGRATAEYRRRSVASGFDAAQAEIIVIGGERGALELRKVDGNWGVAGKPKEKVQSDAVTDLVAVLANLKAERFAVDSNATLKLFGLEKPQRTISARTGSGQSIEIHLGHAEGGSKRVYAALPGKKEVFVLSESDSARLMAELKQK